MKVICKPVGPVMANCYFVINDQNHCLIIDPGDDAKTLSKAINSLCVEVDGILLTHAHFDHIAAVDQLAKDFNADVYICEKEFDFLTDPMLNASAVFMGVPEVVIKTQPKALVIGTNVIGTFEVKAYYTPGHSIGSMIFAIENDLFTGDTLFQGSIGRTDLPSGSDKQMRNSLKFIQSFKTNFTIYPGHGASSTLEIEKAQNPYLIRKMF